MLRTISVTLLSVASAFLTPSTARAEVAGATTTVGVGASESTQLAFGWSVKKRLLGQAVYDQAGQRIGNIEDLIVAPNRTVSYVIVAAGGFVGIDRHDVAIPVGQIQEQGGKLVIPRATRDAIKALPTFDYASDAAQRDRFISNAERDIAKGNDKVAELQQQAGMASADAKDKIDRQTRTIQEDMKSADAKLYELKLATAKRWKAYEARVGAAIARLRNSIENATG